MMTPSFSSRILVVVAMATILGWSATAVAAPDLEAAIMPPNLRERVKPVKSASLRGSTPQLPAEPVNTIRRR